MFFVYNIAGDLVPDPEAPANTGEGQADAPATDDGLEVAAPTMLQQTVTYGIGAVIGVVIALCVLYYLCRKPSDQASPSSGSGAASLPYAKLATDDIEKGGGLELSSRGSNSSRTSTDDESDPKTWDDWDEDAEDGNRGEFVQHSCRIGSSAPPVQRPHDKIPIPAAPVRSTSSSGSLGKILSRSVSPATKRRVSPKVSRQRKVSPPLGDDLFAVSYYVVQHVYRTSIICAYDHTPFRIVYWHLCGAYVPR